MSEEHWQRDALWWMKRAQYLNTQIYDATTRGFVVGFMSGFLLTMAGFWVSQW